MLPQQTERNVHVLGKEDGCGASFLVTLANVMCQFFKGRKKKRPVELIRKKKGVLKKPSKKRRAVTLFNFTEF